jgi:hypothetical protein
MTYKEFLTTLTNKNQTLEYFCFYAKIEIDEAKTWEDFDVIPATAQKIANQILSKAG